MPKTSARKLSSSTSRRRGSFLRKLQRSKPLKAFIAAGMLVLMLFISAGFLGAYSVYRSLTQNFVSAFSSSSTDILNQDIYTIVLVNVADLNAKPLLAKDIVVFFYDTNSKKSLSYKLDASYEFDMPGKYSEEPLSKAIALGMMTNDGNFNAGVDQLTNSVEKVIGYKIDKYLITNDTKFLSLYSFFNNANVSDFMNLSELPKLGQDIKTNMSLNEFYYTYKFINGLPSERISTATLSREQMSNTNFVDDSMKDISFDSRLAQERKSVAILNGSGISGVAGFGSRILENNGGRVVALDNTQTPYEESIIICDDPDSYTVQYLSRFFKVDKIITKQKAADINEFETDRADVTFIIGIDIAETLY